jgi:uncharacterized membrane protein YeaQ/YmgE (transglycosylase-associated protein family)
MSFVIWIATGSLVGWLAGRSEQSPAVPEYTVTGIVGAILGGLLWAPFFFESQTRDISVYVFDFLSFHIFASLCGATLGFWILELLRRRGQTKAG